MILDGSYRKLCVFLDFSPTAEAIRQRAQPGTIVRQMTRPSEMLFYMGEVLGFSVQFTDFPQVRKH